MVNDQRDDAAALESIAKSLDRITRQLDAGLKFALKERQGERSTTEMILMLSELDCANSDIANWLCTPLTSVRPIVSRARKSAKPTGGKKAKR